jgi:hypothetical protein
LEGRCQSNDSCANNGYVKCLYVGYWSQIASVFIVR